MKKIGCIYRKYLNFQALPKSTAVFLHAKPRILSSGYSHVGLIRNGSLYMWGSASAGCLGFGPMVTKYSLPQQVELLNSYQVEVISVSCGKNHTIVLTNFGVSKKKTICLKSHYMKHVFIEKHTICLNSQYMKHIYLQAYHLSELSLDETSSI